MESDLSLGNGSDFFFDIIQKSLVIGIGAWTGSILCSPTLFGTTRGLIPPNLRSELSQRYGKREKKSTADTLLFF
jgi:hypothetical protein